MGLSPSTGAGMGDKIEASDSDHALDPLRGMVMAGMLEGDSYWGPDKDPFSAQIEDAGTKYEWQLIDGKAVLTTTGGGGRSQDS